MDFDIWKVRDPSGQIFDAGFKNGIHFSLYCQVFDITGVNVWVQAKYWCI
jgi:hypothetical protein